LTPDSTAQPLPFREAEATAISLWPATPQDIATLSAFEWSAATPRATTIPAQPLPPSPTDWMVPVLLLIFGLMAYLRVTDGKRVQQLLNAFVSNRFIQQMLREEQVFTHRSSIGLGLVSLLSGGLFLTQLHEMGYWSLLPWHSLVLFAAICGVLLLFMGAKIIAVNALGGVLQIAEATSEYTFNILLFNTFGAVLLLPVSIALAFLPVQDPHVLVGIGTWLVIALFGLRFFKLFLQAVSTTKFSKFYIISYFCTLEIWPLWWLWSFAPNN
ncbi:MAG: DUF4271 domain-containing protein, partial [Bacteroidota bacterium]